jgi:[ribosomal protein S18]-alanine N-acetyltransferase
MSEWIIEPLQLERDLDDIIALEAICFTNPTTREMFRHEVESSDVLHAYVMRHARSPQAPDPPGERGAVAAYCAVWILFDELHINTLAVHPDWRRQGLASLLLTHVLDDAVRLGADKATLEVRRSNEGALKLYERFGFEVGGVRKEYYRQPVEDALILWRTGLRSPWEGSPPNSNGLA